MPPLRKPGHVRAALLAVFCISTLLDLWLVEFRLAGSGPSGFYGWQTEAFVARQLPLKMAPNPMLAQLENPYDGAQNLQYRVLDASYYKGKYYSYFGVGPILMLTLPWRLLTHTYLTEPGATAILVILTNAVSLALLLRIHRAFASSVGGAELVAAYLLVALGNYTTIHLTGGINAGTVAQAGAYFCFTACLHALLCTLGSAQPRRGLFAMGLLTGLAVACRPSFLPIVLLIAPFAWRLRRARAGGPEWARALAPYAAPLAAIIAGLMAYNYARFDSVWEFGNRLQLNSTDFRTVAMFSANNLERHAPGFLFAPIQFVHYFPFVANIHDVVPIGLLWACPASILGLGALSFLRRATDPLRAEAGQFALGLALAFAGLFAFLAAFLLFLFHYEVDFIVPWVWLVALGWFGALSDPVIRGAAHAAVRWAGILLCAASAAVAVMCTLNITDFSPRIPRLVKAVNGVVYRIDLLRGISYGGIHLSARFPSTPSPDLLPIVMTGQDHFDMVYAKVDTDSSVRIGYYHDGAGGPLGDPVIVDPGRPHDIEVFMGSLLPPPAHPYFADWPAAAIFRAKKGVEVRIDGRPALTASVDFYESAPADTIVGANPKLSGIALERFPGQISGVAVVPIEARAYVRTRLLPEGADTFTLRLPSGPKTGNEPLVSTGVGGRGDLVYITYLPDSTYSFGVDHWGGAFDSKPIRLDPSKPHTLRIVSDAFAGPASAIGHIEIFCDSSPVLTVPMAAYPSDPDRVYLGINAIGSSLAPPMFGGTIIEDSPQGSP